VSEKGHFVGVSRGRFISASTAAAAIAGLVNSPASAEPVPRPHRTSLGKARHFAIGKPVNFTYPDKDAPALAVRLSSAIPGGVGPGGDIVAYSQLCVHKGCPVSYSAETEVFVCPCHYSVYDADKAGEVVIGHATTKLPRILLAYDPSTDEITATGVQGVIYGRSSGASLARKS
jgi:arsenite oxidase small subunit